MLGAEELGAPWLGAEEPKMKHSSYSEPFQSNLMAGVGGGVAPIMTKHHVNTGVQTRRAAGVPGT